MKIEIKCCFCGSTFLVGAHSSRRDTKYCSNQCQHDYAWHLRKLRIEKTKKFLSTREARRWLLEKYGHVCGICARKTWRSKPIPLILDHVDGRHHNMDIKNYRMICPNCDAQTPTYKAKNKGNGAVWRRERYLPVVSGRSSVRVR